MSTDDGPPDYDSPPANTRPVYQTRERKWWMLGETDRLDTAHYTLKLLRQNVLKHEAISCDDALAVVDLALLHRAMGRELEHGDLAAVLRCTLVLRRRHRDRRGRACVAACCFTDPFAGEEGQSKAK